MSRRKIKLPIDHELFLSLISGLEAGISTTAAIIAGVVIGTESRSLVVISSLVAIVVQAFNSAINLIYTAHTADEIMNSRDKDSLATPIVQAGLQFATHVAAGLIVLMPIIYVIDLAHALVVSITIALGFLAWIGFVVGRTVKHEPLVNSIHSLLLGALIIAGGFGAGLLIN